MYTRIQPKKKKKKALNKLLCGTTAVQREQCVAEIYKFIYFNFGRQCNLVTSEQQKNMQIIKYNKMRVEKLHKDPVTYNRN